MKNHVESLEIQQLGLGLMADWCEADSLRPCLIRHGLCDCIRTLLSTHLTDSAIVEGTVTVLRLVTLEEEGRVRCQRINASELVVSGMTCHTHQARIQTDGCAILGNLAIDVNKNSVNIVSQAVLDAVTMALVGQTNAIVASERVNAADWATVKSACFAIKNLVICQDNRRALASRDDLLQALETTVQYGPRRCKDAVRVLEKLQLSRVQDESLQSQLLDSLQQLWSKPVPEAIDEILQVWKEHTWSRRVLVVSMHQIQDMWQGHEYKDMDQLDRIVEATKALEEHPDQLVTNEVRQLQGVLAED